MAKVSVVIPVYNTKDYLARCVNSVLNQTFTDISVILVDDGSTDGSSAVCDSFMRDKRVQVIHKENGGLSSARNAGIERAEGEYICFVDSDDYLTENAIERLILSAKSGADVVICGYYLDYGKEKRENFVNGGNFSLKTLGGIFCELKAKHIFDPAWNKLIRLDFLRENGVLFCEGELYEDTDFNIRLLKCNPNISIISDCLYYYVQRQGSITKRFNPTKLETLKKRALDLIDLSLLINNEKATAFCNYFYVKYVFSCFIDCNRKDSGFDKQGVKKFICSQIKDPVFLEALKSAKGASLLENGVICIAKTKSVFLIRLFCKIMFKVR